MSLPLAGAGSRMNQTGIEVAYPSDILDASRRWEKSYKWQEAAGSYKLALSSISEQGPLRTAKLTERIGYALHRAALQSDSTNAFRDTMRAATAEYSRAAGLYERAGETEDSPFILRCRAMHSYLEYWIAREASEKRSLLGESWHLTKMSLKDFHAMRNSVEFLETFNQLSLAAHLRLPYLSDPKVVREECRQAWRLGELAVKCEAEPAKAAELSRGHVTTASFLMAYYGFFEDSR